MSVITFYVCFVDEFQSVKDKPAYYENICLISSGTYNLSIKFRMKNID